MRKSLAACVASFVVGLVGVLAAAPAEATTSYYGQTSRQVARELGCRHFTAHRGGGTVYRTGVCWLRGRRVNVITFRGPAQQRRWNAAGAALLGRFYFWGNGRGAIVVARNGNLPAARLGARLLPGHVRHGR